MNYQQATHFSHEQADKIGLLITNLGTPDAPTPKALRRYLAEFLSDPRVVEFPRLLWRCILHGVILRIRPARSAKSYQSVWTEEGSPLLLHTQAQAQALAAHFANHAQIEVAFAMRYGSPSIACELDKLLQKGVRKLVVLPLYPQYSGSTTGSTFDAIAADFTQRRWLPELRFVNEYASHPAYIDAVAQSIQAYWAQHGRAQKLIFSYHGVPTNYLHKGDPYHCQCLKTSRLIAEHLGLSSDEYLTSFQSRFGRQEWLKPYTDYTLKALPSAGVTHVQVVCPGFAADCLETIEEIGEENREYFMHAGGQKFEYIPALNSSPLHIAALAKILEENMSGWNATSAEANTRRANLAKACPFNLKS